MWQQISCDGHSKPHSWRRSRSAKVWQFLATKPAPILEPGAKIMWPDRRLQKLFKTEFPIVLAPMAGAMDADLVIAVAQGGALGSLPCALLSVEKAREQVSIVRQRVSAPINMNFFCHQPVEADAGREAKWRARLAAYYAEHGLDPAAPIAAAHPAPFDAAL